MKYFTIFTTNFFISNEHIRYCFEPEFTLLNEDNTLNRMSSTIYNLWIEFIRSETEEREKKLKRGKKHNTQLGRYNGGKIQFGYTVNSENFFIIDPEEAQIVHKIFDLYNSGEHSVYSVSQELNLLGYTKRGKQFSGPMIHKILKCQTYAGGDVFPQIIDKDVLSEASERLAGNRNQKKTKEVTRVSLGAGLIRCQCCGRKYFREHKIYLCIGKKKNGQYTGECTGRGINAELLDMLIASIIVPLHIGYLSSGIEKTEEEIRRDIEECRIKIDNLRQNIEKIQKRRERLQTDFYSGRSNISEDAFDDLIESNDNEREKNEAEIKLLNSRISTLEARIMASRSDDEREKFVKIFQNLSRISRVREEDKNYLKELVRMHIREITTDFNEQENKQHIYIWLEDGRCVEIRYMIPRGWSEEECIGQLRVDDGDWKDAVYSQMRRFGKREMWLSRKVIFGLDETANKILNVEFGGALGSLKPRISDFQI